MAPNALKWIDVCYVQNVLQKAENDQSIKICNITVKLATAKGDNYLSDIYRVSVELSRVLNGHDVQEKRSLIIKLMPMNDIRETMISSLGIFDIEMSMVSDTLPRMNHLLSEIGMPALSARCLFMQQEKPVHLLFEDLATRGFRMADRHVGLDLEHCLLAIRNLGRFHASSIALKEKDPTALTRYTKGSFHKDGSPQFSSIVNTGVKALAKETRKWDELNPRISEKLHKLSKVAFEKACKATEYQEDEFNVLTHGDFNINNSLFTYNELSRPIEHIFVDFQICHHGSPVTDIGQFLVLSPSENIRINHRETILREYHNSLTNTMAMLKCKTEAPSFDSLQEILKKRTFYEVIVSSVFLPISLLDNSQTKGLEEVLSEFGPDYEHPGYRGESYRKVMSRLLPLYDSMGFLD